MTVAVRRTAPSTAARTQITSSVLLREGSRGPAVAQVQRQLKSVGFNPGPIDGIFGPRTRAAVIAFQKHAHIAVDGVVGPQTRGALAKFGANGAGPADGYDPPAPSGSLAQRVLNEAASHLGFRERGENGNPFSRYFGRPSEAWCADFVSYVFEKSGRPLGQNGVGFAAVRDMAAWFQRRGAYFHGTPKPGDVIFFDNTRPGTYNHVGVVSRVEGGVVYTIEGNTSDQVARRSYPLGSSRIVGYGRP